MTNTYAKKSWSELKVGSNGDATQVPFHLQELAKNDCPRWDHVLRLKMLYDDGKVYSAAAKAIPEVVKLLAVEATPHKDTLLVLIAATLCGRTQTRMVWGLDMSRPEIKNFYTRGVAKDVWQSTWVGRDVYLFLLDHADEKVRSAAAFLLAFDFEGASQLQIKVEPLLLKESNTKTKASMLLCLGLARQYAPTHVRQLQFSTIIEDTTNELLVRTAAILALLYESRELVTLCDSHKSILIDACGLVKINHNGYPWNNGIIDMHVCRVVESRCEEGGLIAAEILAECIRRYGPTARSHEWAGGILTLAFPRADDVQATGPFLIDASIYDMSVYSDRQRSLIDVLASYSFAAPFLLYGMPAEVSDRRRWAGLEAPGAMERIVEVEIAGQLRRWPVWKVLRQHQALNPNSGIDVDAVLGNVLTPTQLLEVWIDYCDNAYSLRLGGWVFQKVMERSREMLPWARTYLKYMSRIFKEFGGALSGGSRASVTAMHVLIKEGHMEEVVPEYDILLHPDSSVIYQHFDIVRREALIISCLEKCFINNADAFWLAKHNALNTLKNLSFFPTEAVANKLFDIRDYILSHFNEFSDVRVAIETECQKHIDKNDAFADVVKKRLECPS